MANLEEFRIPQYEGCGIYAIVNSKKMSCYIGSSKNIKLTYCATSNKLCENL